MVGRKKLFLVLYMTPTNIAFGEVGKREGKTFPLRAHALFSSDKRICQSFCCVRLNVCWNSTGLYLNVIRKIRIINYSLGHFSLVLTMWLYISWKKNVEQNLCVVRASYCVYANWDVNQCRVTRKCCFWPRNRTGIVCRSTGVGRKRSKTREHCTGRW